MNRKRRSAANRAKRPSKHPPAETTAGTGPGGIADLLAAGGKLHQAGRLAAAEACYRRVLAAQPKHAGAHCNLGVALQQQGKLDEAVAAYRQAISIKPDLAAAHYNLGNALKDQSKLDEAVAAYRQAIGIKPDYAAAHSNLGRALKDQGKLDEAIAAYRQGISIKPDLAEIHYNLGNALKNQGKLDEAIAAYRQGISIKPDLAEAHYYLGNVFYDGGRFDEAVAAYSQATSINPRFADAYSNLGAALEKQKKLDEAVAAYRQAIRLKPDFADAYSNLGVALEQQDKFDEAIAAYRQAISIEPDHADAYSNLGVALEEQGKFNEARNALERAIELAPRRAVAYRLLGDVKRFAATDPHLAAMEKLARDMVSLSAEDQIDLHFALAKAYGDIGHHARSFRNLLQGNALNRQRISYSEADTHDLFGRLQDVFTLASMRGKRGLGDPSSKPVFIIGMPRSGTTLVEQILASHPSVYGAGELDYMANAVAKLSGRDAASMRFPEAVSSMTDEQLRQLGASYVSAVSALAPTAERITDKMPQNLLYAGLIHLALPNARLIHTRRDPIDTCVSCFAQLFSKGHTYSYDLAELGGYYRAYEALMEHWRKVLPPGVMLEVQYENVTADLEAEARRIVAHCGLEWDGACLFFHETERPVRTTIQVRQPIYRNSVGRWRLYERHLAPLIGALGLHFGRGSESEPSAHVQAGVATSGGALALSLSDDAPTSQIPIDAINTVTIHNGLLRIGCVAAGPNREERSTGTLLIPGNQAGPILESLTHAVQELDKKLREQAQQATAAKAN